MDCGEQTRNKDRFDGAAMNSDLVELIQKLDLQQYTLAFDEAGMDDLGDLVELTGDVLGAWGLDDHEAIRLLSAARQDDPLDYARFTAATRDANAADAEDNAAVAEEAVTLAAWLASVKLGDYAEVLFDGRRDPRAAAGPGPAAGHADVLRSADGARRGLVSGQGQSLCLSLLDAEVHGGVLGAGGRAAV